MNVWEANTSHCSNLNRGHIYKCTKIIAYIHRHILSWRMDMGFVINSYLHWRFVHWLVSRGHTKLTTYLPVSTFQRIICIWCHVFIWEGGEKKHNTWGNYINRECSSTTYRSTKRVMNWCDSAFELRQNQEWKKKLPNAA